MYSNKVFYTKLIIASNYCYKIKIFYQIKIFIEHYYKLQITSIYYTFFIKNFWMEDDIPLPRVSHDVDDEDDSYDDGHKD